MSTTHNMHAAGLKAPRPFYALHMLTQFSDCSLRHKSECCIFKNAKLLIIDVKDEKCFDYACRFVYFSHVESNNRQSQEQ